MSNNSTSGGYLIPTSSQGLPGDLTLNQFIQTVLVGISGLPGQFVRPSWQKKPPAQPDIDVNWIAYGINITTPDANAYVAINNDGNTELQRQELLEIKCSFYGAAAYEISTEVRDGFQIQQNLDALRTANMGFAWCDNAVQLPDLVNESWVQRIDMGVFLRRQRQRIYPILEILSAKGTVQTTLGSDPYSLPWDTTKRRA